MLRIRRFSRAATQVTALTATIAVGIAVLASTPAHAAGTVIGVTLTTADLSQGLTPQPSITLGPVSSGTVNLSVDNTKTYQTIDGFGASFTDTSTYLLQNKVSAATRDRVMRDLFSRGSGLGLSLMRVPMGSSDYTATPANNPGTYSYDDNNGVSPTPPWPTSRPRTMTRTSSRSSSRPSRSTRR